MEMEKEMTIEQTFEELDRILETLESSDTTLEESFASYERGMKLVKACSEKIDQVEKKMIVLREGEEDGGEG
ncbi:MAG: exodeoxyribonuclease VII small subunit [Clostridiales bacterium]|nr:exodeoxyribonuclease VII small subunit [Clostridiales bacterium]